MQWNVHEEMPAFPSICSQLHCPSALEGNWDPSTAGHTGATLPTELPRAGNLCPWEAASERKRKCDLSHGGVHWQLCASLCSIRRDSGFTHSAILTHWWSRGRFELGQEKAMNTKSTGRYCSSWPRLCAEVRGSTGDIWVWLRFLCRFIHGRPCLFCRTAQEKNSRT